MWSATTATQEAILNLRRHVEPRLRLLGDGSELVADAVARLDEGVRGSERSSTFSRSFRTNTSTVRSRCVCGGPRPSAAARRGSARGRGRARARRGAGTRSASARRSCRHVGLDVEQGRAAAPRSRSARRGAPPARGRRGARPPARARPAPSSRTASRGSRRPPVSSAWTRSCSVPRAETTTIGVPIPSPRAVSISRHPSTPGSIRSSTQTSGCSKRSRASPDSPFETQSGSKPALVRWRAIPWAMTSSSSMIRTLATRPIMIRGLEAWGRVVNERVNGW